MHDGVQAREVITLSGRFGELEETMELCGDHVTGSDAVFFDQSERLFGLKFIHDDERMASM